MDLETVITLLENRYALKPEPGSDFETAKERTDDARRLEPLDSWLAGVYHIIGGLKHECLSMETGELRIGFLYAAGKRYRDAAICFENIGDVMAAARSTLAAIDVLNKAIVNSKEENSGTVRRVKRLLDKQVGSLRYMYEKHGPEELGYDRI
ncbi:MAG: hypothetical protein ABH817_01585 [archaeon]